MWCARRHTHTRVTPYTRRQRERDAREGLSVHAETARSVDPRDFRNGGSAVTIEETESRATARESVSRRRTRRIEGRSMTVADPTVRSTGGPIGDFSASRDAGIRHRLFLLLYAGLLRLELQVTIQPHEYELSKFVP